MKNIELIKSFRIFDCLTPIQFDYLVLNSKTLMMRKDSYLHQNDQYYYFLLKGKLKVCELDQDGEEIIKYILRPGSFFSESNRNTSGREEFAVATSSSPSVLRTPKGIIVELQGTNRHFATEFNQLALQKCSVIEHQLRMLILKDTKQRLMRLIGNMAKNDGINCNNIFVVNNYLTHREIASLIGATRVTVTKFLREMKASGDLDYNRHRIKVFNQDLLSA